MTPSQPHRYVIAINGAPVPEGADAESPHSLIPVTWDQASGGRGFAVESRNWDLTAEFDGHAQDLIDIASAAHAADRLTSRGGSRDVHRDKWQRDLLVCVPVFDPAFWSAPDVTNVLSEALHFGTGDTWRFAFSQRRDPSGQRALLTRDRSELHDPDCVLLVSGGMDSLCALVQALEAGRRPLLVSQSAANHVFAQQHRLITEVQGRFPGWPCPWLAFDIHGKSGDPVSNSLRSRGFLFAALGIATAGRFGFNEVHLADNGYVSINPPISAQFVGSLASRGTHPLFLELVNRLAGLLFPALTITNPLAAQTRADTLRRLDGAGHADLITWTRSCSKHRGRSNAVPHCGGCSQCVDRRFAVVASGLDAHDPADRYEIDIFAGAIPEGEPRTVATSFIEFARRTEASSDQTMLLDVPELLDCVTPGSTDAQSDLACAIEVLRGHAQDVLSAFSREVSTHARDIAGGTVHPCSLLGLMHPSTRTESDAAEQPMAPRAPLARHRTAHPAEPRNAMHLHQKVWHVAFQGEKATITAAKGMLQLAILVKHEGQQLDVIALSRAEARAFGAQGIWQGLRVGGSAVLDEHLATRELRELRTQRRQLEAEIQTDRANERQELAAQKSDVLRELDQYIKARTGKGGAARSEGGEVERARKGVSKSVRRAYAMIDVVLPALRSHLDAFVDLGVPPTYAPEPPVGWDVQH